MVDDVREWREVVCQVWKPVVVIQAVAAETEERYVSHANTRIDDDTKSN